MPRGELNCRRVYESSVMVAVFEDLRGDLSREPQWCDCSPVILMGGPARDFVRRVP